MQEPKRVFLGSIATETNTFSPLRTDIRDFKESFYAPPGQHPKTPTLCSAVYPAARVRAAEFNWQIVEGTASWAEPGGVINQHTWEFLRDQLLTELRAAMPVDIVLLGLHGAMVSQGCLDCEGELLRAVREIVGTTAIIGATFDPHSHLSERRYANADIITVFKEFPHTDFVEVAENLVDLVQRSSMKEIAPVISTFDCKMIEVLPTSREPMRGFVDKIKALEGSGSILSISVIHGFMAGDVPDLGSRIVVITNDDQVAGDNLAADLGAELFSMRGKTRPEFLTACDAFDKAESPVLCQSSSRTFGIIQAAAFRATRLFCCAKCCDAKSRMQPLQLFGIRLRSAHAFQQAKVRSSDCALVPRCLNLPVNLWMQISPSNAPCATRFKASGKASFPWAMLSG